MTELMRLNLPHWLINYIIKCVSWKKVSIWNLSLRFLLISLLTYSTRLKMMMKIELPLEITDKPSMKIEIFKLNQIYRKRPQLKRVFGSKKKIQNKLMIS
jgi:hypothetical protein